MYQKSLERSARSPKERAREGTWVGTAPHFQAGDSHSEFNGNEVSKSSVRVSIPLAQTPVPQQERKARIHHLPLSMGTVEDGKASDLPPSHCLLSCTGRGCCGLIFPSANPGGSLSTSEGQDASGSTGLRGGRALVSRNGMIPQRIGFRY